ncbi:hypothetical protein OFB80_28815, partial [Escherichia coli]|nr:hypothetical protein [Escherichia coli]
PLTHRSSGLCLQSSLEGMFWAEVPSAWSCLVSSSMQISATLVKGKARVQFGANKSQYSLTRAQQSYKSLVQIHEKNGWYTPPKEDG